ncbi:PIR Superfamily Protein [Plasmodium ovale curtisi]|uniref:PIR Superfamily Protein n=1 Tax=Plasmodium ovale curtisi TaxID=864141 RepID=A0A1A8WJ54_PLAOA|nr:PIR Superfamily Protein [Plasmodium ovale curtisi]
MLIIDTFNIFKEELSKRCMYFKYWIFDKAIINGFLNEQIIEFFELFDVSNNKNKFYITDNREDQNYREPNAYRQINCHIYNYNLDDIKKLKLSLYYIENYYRTKNTNEESFSEEDHDLNVEVSAINTSDSHLSDGVKIHHNLHLLTPLEACLRSNIQNSSNILHNPKKKKKDELSLNES